MITKIEQRIPGAYDVDAVSLATGLLCDDASLTQQSQKEEADINTIVRRFGITGQISHVDLPPPLEEFGEIFDFQSAMDVMNAAKASFMDMSAETRARFLNDPGRFVNFCSEVGSDGKLANLEEMRKMGLAVPAVEPVPERIMKVEVVNAPVPAEE